MGSGQPKLAVWLPGRQPRFSNVFFLNISNNMSPKGFQKGEYDLYKTMLSQKIRPLCKVGKFNKIQYRFSALLILKLNKIQ